jgi:Family of unknown function (DUF6069)
MVATTRAAALAQAVGVDFEVPDGGKTIRLAGFAVVAGFFSVVGIVIAAAVLRWSARPTERMMTVPSSAFFPKTRITSAGSATKTRVNKTKPKMCHQGSPWADA